MCAVGRIRQLQFLLQIFGFASETWWPPLNLINKDGRSVSQMDLITAEYD